MYYNLRMRINPFKPHSSHLTIKPESRRFSTRLSSAATSGAERVKSLFRTKSPEIYHLGGMALGVVESKDEKRIHKSYYYEKIPVKTANGDLFLYGKTLKPYVEKWIREVKAHRFEGTFQDYMNQPELIATLETKKVHYFNEVEQNQTEVIFENGQLKQVGLGATDEALKPLPRGKYAFVIANKRDPETGELKPHLYASLKSIGPKGKTQHSSFTKGSNVISAGMIEINDRGGISSVQNYSGHYRPTDVELKTALRFLKDAGYDLSTFCVTYYSSDLKMGLSNFLNIGRIGYTLCNAEKWLRKKGG